MTTTGAYDPGLDALIRGPLEHVYRVEVYDPAGVRIPLDVTACRVTMDEGWWPFVQGTISAKVSDDQATLDRLDARQRLKVLIYAGYRKADGTEDVHLLAQTWVISRTVTRPDDTVELAVAGGEYLYGRAIEIHALTYLSASWSSDTQARDAVHQCLLSAKAVATQSDWAYEEASRTTGWSGDMVWNGSEWVDQTYGGGLPDQGAVLIEVAQDIANRCACWFRCDERGIWRLTGRPVLVTPQAALQLKVGEFGTVLGSGTALARDEDWANAVMEKITYNAPWLAAGEDTVYGYAYVSEGPYSVDAAGLVATLIERTEASVITLEKASLMAGAVLARKLALGRTIDVEAVAAYWLRPCDTVTVQLPLGPQERLLVSAVTFDLDAGSMSVKTRLPENSTGITIGG